MEDNIKTVRMIVKPGFDKEGNPNVTIPKTLNDPYLKKTVELNPDAVVSEDYANAYTKSYAGYEIVGNDYVADKSKYLINENYREPEIAAEVDNLTPVKKDVVFAFVKFMRELPENEAEDFKANLDEALEDIKTYKVDKEKYKDVDKVKTEKGTGDPNLKKLKTFEECLRDRETYSPGEIATEIGSNPMDVGKQLTALQAKGFLVKEGNVYKPTEQYKQILKETGPVGGDQTNNGNTN